MKIIPHVNDYRNPVVAEAMKTLKYVNMFNHGVRNVQELLSANESSPAVFHVDYLTVFQVIIEDANVTDARRLAELQTEQNSNTKLEQITPSLPKGFSEVAQKLTTKDK